MQSAVEQLRKYREENSRSHDEVVELWTNVLSKHNLSKLADEKWLIIEQVFKSALHCFQLVLASQCLKQLTEQFKSPSRRLAILRGMYYETTGEYDKAEEIYSDLLKDNETDATVQKRQICLLKAQNRTNEAIAALNTYLNLYQVNQIFY